jgi:hypothetical protein
MTMEKVDERDDFSSSFAFLFNKQPSSTGTKEFLVKDRSRISLVNSLMAGSGLGDFLLVYSLHSIRLLRFDFIHSRNSQFVQKMRILV